jgi:hypothetical protein
MLVQVVKWVEFIIEVSLQSWHLQPGSGMLWDFDRMCPFPQFQTEETSEENKGWFTWTMSWTTVHLGLNLLSSQPCTAFISWHLWHFGIYVPFMFITLDKNVHWFQILMAGKSPSRVEMVLKGLDNQLEIATLDSLGKAISDKFVFSLMVQDGLTFLSCLLICCCQVWISVTLVSSYLSILFRLTLFASMERFSVFMKICDKQKKSRISETVLQGIIPNVFPLILSCCFHSSRLKISLCHSSMEEECNVERMVHKAGPTFSLLKYALYWYLNPSFCIVLTLVLPKHSSP